MKPTIVTLADGGRHYVHVPAREVHAAICRARQQGHSEARIPHYPAFPVHGILEIDGERLPSDPGQA